jgi:hypothetical protein
MVKSSEIAWKLVPLRHFFPLKVVPLIKVLQYSRTSVSGRESNTLEAPAYRIIPLNVAHSALETSQKPTEDLQLIDTPLKSVPLIEVRLYGGLLPLEIFSPYHMSHSE